MSAPSAPRISFLPRALPGSLEFWWEPPDSDGGSPVTGYTLSCANPSLSYSYGPTDGYAWLQGLTDGVDYLFELTATNTNGTGPAATYLLSVPGTPSTPPTSVVPAAAGQEGIAVTYSPPASNVAPILNYYAKATNIANSNVYQFTANSSTPSVVIPVPDTLSSFYNVQVQAYSAPGWSELSAIQSQQTSAPQVYGCYISNCDSQFYPVIDAQGNAWITGAIQNTTLPVTLYNRFGTAVQSIQPTTGLVTLITAYISADGVSNCWMAKVTCGANIFFTGINLNSQRNLVDTNNNLIRLISFVNSTSPITFYDKNNSIIKTYTPNNASIAVLKLSPTGVYEGSSDTNTWVAVIQNSAPVNQTTLLNWILDNQNNIIFGGQAVNSSGSSQTLSTYDKTGTQFGTSIPLRTGTGYAYLVKIASNGLSTGSWNAYFTIDNAQATVAPSAIQYNESIQVNSSNQIIWCVRFRGSDNQVYGSDNVKIGANLPYTAGANNQDTCIVRLAEDGTAANSWRVVLQSLSNPNNEMSLNILVDTSDNILGVGWCAGLTSTGTFYALNTSDAQVTNMNFAFSSSLNNMYIVKYDNSGVPQWVASLRTSGSTVIIGLPNNIQGVPQTTRAKLDASGNVIITASFYATSSGQTVGLYNASATLLKSITSPSLNGTNDTFIAKLSSDGSTGYLARIGQVTGGTASVTVPFNLLIDNTQNILVSGQWTDNPTGFFVHTNDTNPAFSTFQGPTGGIEAGNRNTYLARFDPMLSTVSVATLKLINTISGTTFPTFITLDSNQAPICAGSVFASFSMYDFNQSTISTCTRNTTLGGSMFLAKFAGNDTDSWCGLVKRADEQNGNAAFNYIATSGTSYFAPLADLRVNLSTNRIYATGVTSSIIHTLYDGYNSTVQLLGSPSGPNPSTNSFLLSFPADGKTFRQN